jgi:hypothetical protein
MNDENVVATKTLYRLRKTGSTRRITEEFGDGLELPEVELISTDLGVDEYDSYDAVARVEGDPFHLAYYVVQSTFYYDSGAVGSVATILVRDFRALDAGDNEVRRRVAPQTLTGITAQFPGSGSLNSYPGHPIYAVKPARRDTSKATSGHDVLSLRVAEAKD